MRKSRIFKYYNINFLVMIREEHIRRRARITEGLCHAFQQPFSSDAFYGLLYPGIRRGKAMIPYFERTGVNYFEYSSAIDWS